MSNAPKNALITEKKQTGWRIFKRNKMVLNGCMLGLIFATTAQSVFAAPQGGVVTVGQGTITQAGSATNINQGSQRLDINWQSFSTGVSESVNFAQPNASAVAVNRVIGGVPSELRGALNANGRVFILNDSGITFHGTSRVNVGALVATTAKDVIINGDSYSFTNAAGKTSVINKGDITVSQGGFAVLAAPNVENNGYIQADLGQIVLASTSAFTVDLRGDNLITYTVSGEALGKVTNTGTLQAKSGTVEISTKTANDIVSGVINLSGVVDADAFGTDKNGGTILVSGNADLVNKAALSANGGVNGNGGTIITKVSGLNNFTKDATISAKGGTQAGNGGFIDISGSSFIVAGKLDASAPHGDAGTVLFDPATITIKNGSGTATADTLFETALEALSQAGNNVLAEATDSIYLENLADDQLTGGSGKITLRATQNTSTVSFEDKNDSIFTTTGDILVRAGSGGIDIGSLITQAENATPGNITLTTVNGGDIKTKTLSITKNNVGRNNSTVAKIDINSNGDVLVDGDLILDIATGNRSDNKSKADAEVNIDAVAEVEVTGETRVKAVSTHTDGISEAFADLIIDASAITLDAVNVIADATGTAPINYNRTRGYFAGDAETTATANIDITATGIVTLNGDATVDANATTNADSHEDSVSGSVYGEGFANASAGLSIYADDMVSENALTITADAINEGAGNGSLAQADADGYFSLTGGLELGDVMVTADAQNEGLDGYADADASLEVYAQDGILTDALSIAATALNNGESESAADADAGLTLSSEDDGITIDGDIALSASADAENGNSASVYANIDVTLSAAEDITLDGDFEVSGTATTEGNGSNGSEGSSAGYGAYTDANVLITSTDGSIDANGVTITTLATDAGNNQGDDALVQSASARGYFSGTAGRDINIGSLNLDATADNNAKNPIQTSATAEFNLSAGTAEDEIIPGTPETITGEGEDTILVPATPDTIISGGSITFDDNVNVNAYAEASGGDVDADADAYLSAANDVTLSGEENNVIATALNNGDYNEEETIPAGKYDDTIIEAYTEESTYVDGEPIFEGDEIIGYEQIEVPGEFHEAETLIGADYPEEIIPAHYGYARATATTYFSVQAGTRNDSGDVLIDGSLRLASDATTYGSGSTSAYTEAGITALNDVNLNADVDVSATADNAAPNYENVARFEFGRSRSRGKGEGVNADAILDVTAGTGYYSKGGDLSVAGNITVSADASGYTDNVSADAEAYIYARNDITITGDISVAANAFGSAEGYDGSVFAMFGYDSGSSDVSADANLDVYAGKGDRKSGYYSAGTADITGNVSVTAEAEGYNLDTEADADADIIATNDVLITGDVLVQADATQETGGIEFFSSGSADADADLSIEAGKHGYFGGGYYGYFGTGDIDLTGDVDVLATATTEGSSADARAEGELVAANNITLEGDTNVIATTDVIREEVILEGEEIELLVFFGETSPGYESVYSELFAQAGVDEAGDLKITGDIEVASNALSDAGGSASANAELYARDNVDIIGDISVLALNPGLTSESSADAGLYVDAGYNGEEGARFGDADITISGDLDVRAEASAAPEFRRIVFDLIPGESFGDSIPSPFADADANTEISLQANRNVSVIGDIDSSAEASVDLGDSEGVNSSTTAYNTIDIDAGRAVNMEETIEGPMATGDVSITGDIFGNAQVEGDALYQYTESFVSVQAPDDVTLTGSDPRSQAQTSFVQQKFSDVDTIGNESIGGSYAELELRAGKVLLVASAPTTAGGGGGAGGAGGAGGDGAGAGDGGVPPVVDGGTGSSTGGTGGGSTSGGGSSSGGSGDLNDARFNSTNTNDATIFENNNDEGGFNLGDLEPAAGGDGQDPEEEEGFCKAVNAGGGSLGQSCGAGGSDDDQNA